MEMATVYSPWAIKNGLLGKFFMNFYFERHLEDSVCQLRKHLNLTEPPQGSLSNNNVWKL